jgi:tRNA uridine 5-carboxymethylaminomethyl modification enzyme
VGPERKSRIEQHLAFRATEEFRGTDEGKADALYAPYVDRQRREWAAIERDRAVRIPDEFNYRAVPGLSSEMIERLRTAGPERLDQASRVPGITPAALSALYLALSRAAA